MQGFRNYNFEAQQRGQQHSIVVDIIPSQYTKTTTPPLSPNYKGMLFAFKFKGTLSRRSSLHFLSYRVVMMFLYISDRLINIYI